MTAQYKEAMERIRAYLIEKNPAPDMRLPSERGEEDATQLVHRSRRTHRVPRTLNRHPYSEYP